MRSTQLRKTIKPVVLNPKLNIVRLIFISREKSIEDLFKKYNVLMLAFSLFFIVSGFLVFMNSVAVPRYFKEQISHYSVGEKITSLPCMIEGKTRGNDLLARDFSGGLIIIKHDAKNVPLDTFAIIDGTLGQGREFLASEIQTENTLIFKIWMSLVALLFIAWKLVRGMRITSKGLDLLPH